MAGMDSSSTSLDQSESEEFLKTLQDPLPTDPSSLNQLVIQSRQLLSRNATKIRSLDAQLTSIQASYSDLVAKSSKWEDQVGNLKAKIPILEREIREERSKREEEENRVKDLRLTSEESRRAIMRLQVEQNDNRIKAAKEKEKEKANHRRSLGPGAMVGWNVTGAASTSSTNDEAAAEARELKKSKRASLAFGPNAAGASSSAFINQRSSLIGSAPTGHRRSASGSNRSSVIYNNDSGSESEQIGGTTIGRSTAIGGGLRGLRLSGAHQSQSSSSAKDDHVGPNEKSSSRRSSFASTSDVISPRSNNSDLPLENPIAIGGSDPVALTEAALTRSTSLSTRMRGAAGSSAPRKSHSNGEVLEALPGGGLSVPGSSSTLGILNGNSRLSASPTPSQSAMSSMGSPIMEESPSAEQFATMSSSEIDSAIDDDALNTATVSNFNSLSPNPNATTANSNYSNLRSQAILKAKESEIERLKLEMKGLRKNLEESNESRLASETCLKILREFISSHDNDSGEGKAVLGQVEEKVETGGENGKESTGIQLLKGMKLPPLPTDKEVNEDVDSKKSDSNSTTGWSMKLPTFLAKRSESEESPDGTITNPPTQNQSSSSTTSTADKRTSISTPIVTSLGSLWNRTNSNGNASLSPSKIRSRDSISNSSESSSISQSLNPNVNSNDTVTSASASAFGRNIGSWFAKKGSGSGHPSGVQDDSSTSPTKETNAASSPKLNPPSLPFRKPSLHSQSSNSNYSESSQGLNEDGSENQEEEKEKGLGIGFGKGKEIHLNERARKALSRTVSVEEDSGFVPPSFD